MIKNWSKVPPQILKPLLGAFASEWYILEEISARERESCQVTKIFNKILIPSYNGNISIVQWAHL